jgi:hypothetical protein
MLVAELFVYLALKSASKKHPSGRRLTVTIVNYLQNELKQ